MKTYYDIPITVKRQLMDLPEDERIQVRAMINSLCEIKDVGALLALEIIRKTGRLMRRRAGEQ